MGTTATGKTDAAAYLSDELNGEIVSVDSSLVYRHMNIGTAKPDANFLAQYPHHLVDIREPNDTYSAAHFYADASLIIEDIIQRGKVPILAGGTHFYFAALEQGLANLPQADEVMRAEITRDAAQQGWPAMHQKLAILDSVSAERIDSNDAQRIQRALEIVLISGKSVAEHNSLRKPPLGFPMLKIALTYSDRQFLHQRIEKRFDLMLEQGLENEVLALLASGVDPEAPSMRMIGYRQMLEFLQNNPINDNSSKARAMAYTQMRAKGIAATRQLAKRQLTWLRNQSNVLWWVDKGLKDKDFSLLGTYVKQFVI